MNDGYIKIHRKIISDWEWYSNINDTRLWFHCLLKANWKDGYFEGHHIPRGSFVCSYGNLAKETGLSVHQIRTSLNHLILTNNVAIKKTNKFSIISILNYEKYQCDDTPNDKQVANKWQASGKQVATIEERKNIYTYMHSYIKNAYARELNIVEVQLLEQWINDYDVELIKEAVKRSLLKRNLNLNYPNGILKSWKEKGYQNIEDVLINEGKVEKVKEEKEEPIEIFNCNWLEEDFEE